MANATQPIFLRLTIRSVDDDNSVFFSNENDSSAPIEITPGTGQIFPKVDKILSSMTIGDRKTVTLTKEEAFGDYSAEAIKKVPLENLPKELQNPGIQVSTQLDDGQSIQGTVLEITPEHAVIDFNHPLAGKDISVEVVIVEEKPNLQ